MSLFSANNEKNSSSANKGSAKGRAITVVMMALSMVAALFVAPGTPAHADPVSDPSVISSAPTDATIVSHASAPQDADTINVNYQSKPGDELTITLPAGYKGTQNLSSINVPQATKQISGLQATFSFTTSQSVEFSIVLTPDVPYDQNQGKVSRLNN